MFVFVSSVLLLVAVSDIAVVFLGKRISMNIKVIQERRFEQGDIKSKP